MKINILFTSWLKKTPYIHVLHNVYSNSDICVDNYKDIL